MTHYFRAGAWLAIIFLFTGVARAQRSTADSTGKPGDQFSLKGALHLFQQSESPEAFEKALNTQASHVNNLDLNQDGKTDYVRVIDKTQKQAHAFILQVPVSDRENQDIAVIELEKTNDTTAMIQIIGDKDIYGKEVIIEPEAPGKETVNRPYFVTGVGGSVDRDLETVPVDFYVNVWTWPAVVFVYAPLYAPWVSPWRWGFYPSWFVAWRPLAWSAWYPACGVYSHGYVAVGTYRVTGAHTLYTPYRSSAVSVTRQGAAVAGPNGAAAGVRTTVTGPNGRSATRTTVVGAGRNGTFRASGVRRW